MRNGMRIIAALFLLAQSHASTASAAADAGTPQQVAYGAGSVLGTLVYAPFKASFCILGGVASAFTVIASPPTARKMVGASCRGTWAITPDVLKAREQVHFVGDTPAANTAGGR
jgi:hypothetical protein